MQCTGGRVHTNCVGLSMSQRRRTLSDSYAPPHFPFSAHINHLDPQKDE